MAAASGSTAYSVPLTQYLNYTLIDRDIEAIIEDGKDPSKQQGARVQLDKIYRALDASQDPQAYQLKAKCHRVMLSFLQSNETKESIENALKDLDLARQKKIIEYQTFMTKNLAEASELEKATKGTPEAPYVERTLKLCTDEIECFSRRQEVQSTTLGQWISIFKTGVVVALIFLFIQRVTNYFQTERRHA